MTDDGGVGRLRTPCDRVAEREICHARRVIHLPRVSAPRRHDTSRVVLRRFARVSAPAIERNNLRMAHDLPSVRRDSSSGIECAAAPVHTTQKKRGGIPCRQQVRVSRTSSWCTGDSWTGPVGRALPSAIGVEDEAELVSRVHGRPDDSAGRAARDVEARRCDGDRGQGQSRGLCVAAEGRCDAYREGRGQRGLDDAVATQSHKQ